jgi:hypothetical protein
MPRVGFEPTMPVFELTKTIHALGRAPLFANKYTLWTKCGLNWILVQKTEIKSRGDPLR